MEPFKFKEFTIHQDKCAMKIGTDGVLLGAWCSLENIPDTILDIGSGTGILALMMAQRSSASIIDAIEIDEDAFEQTVQNFELSDWGDRLYGYHASCKEFTAEIVEEGETYDLIISNPPFYSDTYPSNDSARNKARFTVHLSFEELLASVAKMLAKDGNFAVIIPFKEEAYFTNIAKKYHLHVTRRCRVKGNDKTEIKRSLLELSFRETIVKSEELTLEKDRHQYTDAYRNLVKDFYLKL
ncbi:tRNA (adenine-N(6)-)-methyltransferase [Tenacibaculum sp. SG-28]|nr:tRNA (adenine-N(6)-)-methyltransferase [Tenacibaculum sp. SG-28]